MGAFIIKTTKICYTITNYGGKMKNPKIPYFYNDKPVFGLDIGPSSLKVMQINLSKNKKTRITGYGFTSFNHTVIENGVIIDYKNIAKSAYELFDKYLIGSINTKRVALAIPAYRTFTRSITLPKLENKEIHEAISLEAEQYIPIPIEELYIDYEIIKKSKTTDDYLVIGVPKEIVDSYLNLSQILGLEAVLIEPTLHSSARLFSLDPTSNQSTIIIDFGSKSADISIYDQGHILITGTVQAGGSIFTAAIQKKLNVNEEEAGLIKTKYGLQVSKKQTEMKEALSPILNEVIKEIKSMKRYYEEHYSNKKPIEQIVTLGGGANMPGLSEYLIDSIRLPVKHSDPWQYINFKGLQPPALADKPMYATVAGLSLLNPSELFHD